MTTIYNFSMTDLHGESVNFNAYKGKVVLIVNTASKCGFTPQYQGLEALHEKHQDQGLVILGFPCNQFGKQEQGSDAEISEFCQLNYGVSFLMFSKTEVNGANTPPLYQYLKEAAPGLLGSKAIKWNFTKFLIGKDGKVITRYASATKPADIETDIQQALEN